MTKSKVLFIVFLFVLVLGIASSVFPLITFPSLISLIPVSDGSQTSLAISINEEPSLPLNSNDSYAPVVQKVAPAMVSIVVESISYDTFRQPYPQEGAGSGVIIDSQGYIVTNNHVVEGASSIKVTLGDGRTLDATLIGEDPWTDLAVVKIQGENFPTASLLRNALSQSQVGDKVIAVGNALALPGGPTVTEGIVSNLGRSIEEPNGVVLYDLIQTSAAINPGNSGGPLVNMAGQVIGINTAIASNAQGIGFAISTNTVIPVTESLISRGYVVRPYLGVSMQTVTPSVASQWGLDVDHGVLITSVGTGSPAYQAGLRRGDVIIRFAGQEVTTSEELRLAIQKKNIGDQVEIVLMRGSNQLTLQATLGETPAP